MTGPEHYQAAEKYLAHIENGSTPTAAELKRYEILIHGHAMLAQTAADITAVRSARCAGGKANRDLNAWVKVVNEEADDNDDDDDE